jgi:hypothetical protein
MDKIFTEKEILNLTNNEIINRVKVIVSLADLEEAIFNDDKMKIRYYYECFEIHGDKNFEKVKDLLLLNGINPSEYLPTGPNQQMMIKTAFELRYFSNFSTYSFVNIYISFFFRFFMDYQDIMEEWKLSELKLDDLDLDKFGIFLKVIYSKYQLFYNWILNLCKMVVSDYFTQRDYENLLLLAKDAFFFTTFTPFGVPVFEDFKRNIRLLILKLEKVIIE